jgi:hypothetical protein
VRHELFNNFFYYNLDEDDIFCVLEEEGWVRGKGEVGM